MLTPDELKAIRERCDKAMRDCPTIDPCPKEHGWNCQRPECQYKNLDYKVWKRDGEIYGLAALTDLPKLLDHIEVLQEFAEAVSVTLDQHGFDFRGEPFMILPENAAIYDRMLRRIQQFVTHLEAQR